MAEAKAITDTNIRDLCKKIASNVAHLLVYDNDAIVIYQDLIGHATVEENKELANDPALMETFYRIYGVAYGTTAAIKFYLNNSDTIAELKADLEYYKDKVEQFNTQLETERKTAKCWRDKADELQEKLYKAEEDKEKTISSLETVRKETIELKAKLYDLQNIIAKMEKTSKS